MGAGALAQPAPPGPGGGPVAAQTDMPGSGEELEAFALFKNEQYITARTKAEAILDRSPDSILANFVLGEVLWQAEGDLSRAMYRMGRARKLFESKYGSPPGKSAPWKFHRDLLYDTQKLAGEMEEYDYQLQVLDYSDALYDPPMIAEHAWPLLMLGKIDEARATAQKAIASKDVEQQSFGRNVLCAIEGELRTRKPYFDACKAAYEGAKAEAAASAGKENAPPTTAVPVNAFNAALAAFSVLQFDEVERLAKEASQSSADTVANPWRLLGRYYTDAGRVAEAVPAMREMNSWRAHEPASLRDQDHAETDVALATLLLVVGEPESALDLVDRAIQNPDRHGLVSSKGDQSVGAYALLRRRVANALAEQEMERASWSDLTEKAKAIAHAEALRARVWPDKERVASILTNDERLDSTFRMYLTGGLEPLPTWLTGDVVSIVGPGVAQVALERARDEDKALPQLGPYFDAIEAEVALASGDEERTIAKARSAIAGLPKTEALLAARAAGVAAEAARKQGDDRTAMGFYLTVLQKDAGELRRLGITIPATVRADGDATAQRAAELLRKSPRLRSDDRGFKVLVSRAGPTTLRACLVGPDGAQLACASAEQPPKEEAKKPASPPSADPRQLPSEQKEDEGPKETWEQLLARAFHHDVFAITVGLSATDLNSLDGSTTVASQAQRDQMTGILKGMASDGQ